MLDYLSAACLAVVALACWTGVFAKTFNDNWLQFLGLVGIGIWCPARAWQIVDYAVATPQQFSMHLALACYALGTAYKVWKNKPPKAGDSSSPPTPLPPDRLRHVVGGRGSP